MQRQAIVYQFHDKLFGSRNAACGLLMISHMSRNLGFVDKDVKGMKHYQLRECTPSQSDLDPHLDKNYDCKRLVTL